MLQKRSRFQGTTIKYDKNKDAIKQGKTTHDEASTDHLIGGKGPHDQTKKSQTAEEGVLLLLGVTERHQAKIPNMQMT